MLNYSTFGEGKDIVFLHGWGGSIDSFIAVANFFSPKFRCTVVDFYGFGKSVADKVYKMQDFADAILEIFDKEKITNACIVGHSFGGRVAMILSGDCRVDKIVLVDSAGVKPRRGIKYLLRKFKFKVLKMLNKNTDNCGSSDYRALSPMMKSTFKNVVNCHLDGILHNIDKETLIIWGKNDKETPLYMAKKLNKCIKNSGLVVLPGGHFCYIENMRVFVTVLQAFLR